MDTATNTEDAQALTDRERAALTAVAIGLPQEQAARRVGLSERRFRRVLANSVEKVGATETIHTVALAAATRQIDPEHLRARSTRSRSPRTCACGLPSAASAA